jgi:hypothetical protein
MVTRTTGRPAGRSAPPSRRPATGTRSSSKDQAAAAIGGVSLGEFSSGLPENLYATVLKARAVATNYNGTQPKYSLAVRLDMQPDPGSGWDDGMDPVYISLGNLTFLVPSNDGKTAVGASFEDYAALANGEVPDDIDLDELEGVCLAPVTPGQKISKNSNWKIFYDALADAKFPAKLIGPAFSFLDGTYGYWVRVKQPERGGLNSGVGVGDLTGAGAGEDNAKTKKGGFEKTVFVLAEYVEHRDVGGGEDDEDEAEDEPEGRPAKRKAAPAPAPARRGKKPAPEPEEEDEEEETEEAEEAEGEEAEEETEEDEAADESEEEDETEEDASDASMEDRFDDAVVKVLSLPKFKKTGGRKPNIAPLVSAEFDNKKDRSEAIALLNNVKYLTATNKKGELLRPYDFDPKTATFSLPK